MIRFFVVAFQFVSLTAATEWATTVDIEGEEPFEFFECLAHSGYDGVFVRVYEPTNGGEVDASALDNIDRAVNFADTLSRIEMYIVPNATSSIPANDQMNEALQYALRSKTPVRAMWIKVANSSNWSNDTLQNVNFLKTAIDYFRERHIDAGIFTSEADWQAITDLREIEVPPRIWYSRVLGIGIDGQTSKDFTDFDAFAGFTEAAAKQYAQGVEVCQSTVNLDTFPIFRAGKF